MKTWKSMTKFALTLAMFLWICRGTQVFAQDAPFVPAPGSPVKVGPGSGGLVLADVNRDGHLDLITQHLLYRNVAVQLGDGKGRFAPAGKSPMKLDYEPSAIAVADVNNDTILDLGIASRRQRQRIRPHLPGQRYSRLQRSWRITRCRQRVCGVLQTEPVSRGCQRRWEAGHRHGERAAEYPRDPLRKWPRRVLYGSGFETLRSRPILVRPR